MQTTATLVLTFAAMAMGDGNPITVNFNPCSAAQAPPTQGGDDECNIPKGTTIVRFTEADFPPYDDFDTATHKVTGWNVGLWDLICATQAFADYRCAQVKDLWTNVWTHEHSPGVGLMDNHYDLAFAYVTTMRNESFDYGTYLTHRPKNYFVGLESQWKDATTGDITPFPDTGAEIKIILNCGWGENGAVRQRFPEAEASESLCQNGVDKQLQAVKDAVADDATKKTVAWVSEEEKNKLPATDSWIVIGSNDGYSVTDDNIQVDALAFMYNKKNHCVRKLVDAALQELMVGGYDSQWDQHCRSDPLVKCMHTTAAPAPPQ